MKTIVLFLIFLLSGNLLSHAQQTVSNLVTLGSVLVEETSVDKMSEVCRWNKLTEQPSDDEFHTYSHDDGTLIKFKMSEDHIPYVEIHTTQSKKSIEKIITQAGYKKDKDCYVKGSLHANKYTTAQIHGNKNKCVTFTKNKSTH